MHVVVVWRGYVGQRDDRYPPGKLVQLVRLEHPVVQDQPVALLGQRQQPPADVVVVDIDGAEQQVESLALGGELDAPVDHVGELEALVLLGESAVAGLRPSGPGG